MAAVPPSPSRPPAKTGAYVPVSAAMPTISANMAKTWSAMSTAAVNLTITLNSGKLTTYVNGAKTVTAGTSTGRLPRRKKLRQVSEQCSRRAGKPHERCTGSLRPFNRLPGEGVWCACHCHPAPVPPSQPPAADWLEALAVWEAARQALDLRAAGDAEKLKRVAELSALRRRREQAAQDAA